MGITKKKKIDFTHGAQRIAIYYNSECHKIELKLNDVLQVTKKSVLNYICQKKKKSN